MSRHIIALAMAVLALASPAAVFPQPLDAKEAAASIQPDKRQKKVDEGQAAAEISRQEGILRKLHDADLNGRIPVPYRSLKSVGKQKPTMVPAPVLSPFERDIRTGKSKIVLLTEFLTKDDAYAFASDLVSERAYDIDTYDPSYSWFTTSWTLVPTPEDWVKPYCPNQFRLHFEFDRFKGGVRVVVSAQWRESVLSSEPLDLFYQPSASYSTSYAWNILEDFAAAVPNSGLDFE